MNSCLINFYHAHSHIVLTVGIWTLSQSAYLFLSVTLNKTDDSFGEMKIYLHLVILISQMLGCMITIGSMFIFFTAILINLGSWWVDKGSVFHNLFIIPSIICFS